MISAVVEGASDTGAVTAILRACGTAAPTFLVQNGTGRLDSKVASYNRAAARSAWLIVRDSDGGCPVTLRHRLLSDVQNDGLVLRIACTMSEAWLMADTEAFASYFRVRRGQIPLAPEDEPHAKRALLRLVTSSSSAAIRRDVVAKNGFPGPLYVARLNEFALLHWRPDVAAERAPSLHRALTEIRRKVASGAWPRSEIS